MIPGLNNVNKAIISLIPRKIRIDNDLFKGFCKDKIMLNDSLLNNFKEYLESIRSKYTRGEYYLTYDKENLYILNKQGDIENGMQLLKEIKEKQKNFISDDLRISFANFQIKDMQVCTVIGKYENDSENQELFHLAPYKTGIYKAGINCLCCFDDKDKEYTFHEIWLETLNKDQIITKFNDLIVSKWVVRISLYFIHLLSIYLILYPFQLLFSTIPYIGTFSTSNLLLFTFILSLITFLFILSIIWIFNRPYMTLFIIGFALLLVFFEKEIIDHYEIVQETGTGISRNHTLNKLI